MLILDIAGLLHDTNGKIKGHYIMDTFGYDYSKFMKIYTFDNTSIFIERWLLDAICNKYLFAWAYTKINKLEHLYVVCLERGDLIIAKYLHKINKIDEPVAKALYSHNLERIKWVYKNISSKLSKYYYTSNNTDIAQWLYDTYPNINGISNIYSAIYGSYISYIEWHLRTYDESQDRHLHYLHHCIDDDIIDVFVYIYIKCRMSNYRDTIIEHMCAEGIAPPRIIAWL